MIDFIAQAFAGIVVGIAVGWYGVMIWDAWRDHRDQQLRVLAGNRFDTMVRFGLVPPSSYMYTHVKGFPVMAQLYASPPPFLHRNLSELETTWSPEPIIAWRSPMHTPLRHEPGERVTAECAPPWWSNPKGQPELNRCSISPGLTCQSRVGDGCGFYAYKERGREGAQYATVRVALSGRVIEYTDGYRAQYMTILEGQTPQPDPNFGPGTIFMMGSRLRPSAP